MIGSRVKKLRIAKGITQQQLADAVGISNVYVSDIERDEKLKTIDTVEKIAVALDVSISALMGNEADLEDETALLNAFGKLNKTDRAAVLSHAIALSEVNEVRRIRK